MGTLTQKIITVPSNPSAGYYRFYPKSDGFYMLNENGIETKIGQVASAFGQNFQTSEKELSVPLSTLTPTAYITLATPSLPLGNYRVGYNFSWSYNDVSGNAAHFAIYDNGIQHNTTDVTMETKNIFDIAHVGSFLYLDAVSGVHTIDLMFHCDNIADTVTVKNAYIEFWRVP